MTIGGFSNNSGLHLGCGEVGRSPYLVKISPHLAISVNNKKLFFMIGQWPMPHIQIKSTCFAQPSTNE